MVVKNSTSSINLAWLKQVPSPIALLDHNFCLIDASAEWCAKFEINNTEKIKNKTLFELFPRLSDSWRTKLEYALEGLKDIQIIDKVELNNGTENSFIWYLNPWKDGYGKNIGVVINIKDITETKKLQIELNRTKNLLKENGTIAKIGSWEYNVEKEELLLSPIVEDIFSIQKNSKLTLKNAIDFYKEGAARKKIQTAIDKAINSGTPWNENLEIVCANGRTISVNTIGRPKFKNGKCARILGTIQDITAKAAPVNNIKVVKPKLSTEYQECFRASPIGMAISDYATGKILEVNEEFSNVTGFSSDELIGQSYKGFQLLSNPSDKSNMLKQLSVTGMFELLRLNFTAKSGEKKIVNISGRLMSGSKKDRKIITSIVNVSMPNSQTENLRKQVTDANENIEKLVNFTHMVSHNLKGHATNFTLLLNFLDNEDREEERTKLLTILKEGNENLTQTIKGLREIVAIRNKNKLKKEELILNDYIYRAERRLAGLLKKEKAKIINEIGDDFKVSALPDYLENILVNCLSNAIKFRKPKKTPVVIVSASANETHTIFSIEDNGIGMDLEKNKNRLFGLYETLGNHGEARGMGLYLTKYQVDLMNGRIEVESTLGEGTTFKIYFPKKESKNKLTQSNQ